MCLSWFWHERGGHQFQEKPPHFWILWHWNDLNTLQTWRQSIFSFELVSLPIVTFIYFLCIYILYFNICFCHLKDEQRVGDWRKAPLMICCCLPQSQSIPSAFSLITLSPPNTLTLWHSVQPVGVCPEQAPIRLRIYLGNQYPVSFSFHFTFILFSFTVS